jgi:hypothetical protein
MMRFSGEELIRPGGFSSPRGGEVGPDGPYGTITWFAINGNGTLIPSGSVSLGASTFANGFTFAQR